MDSKVKVKPLLARIQAIKEYADEVRTYDHYKDPASQKFFDGYLMALHDLLDIVEEAAHG